MINYLKTNVSLFWKYLFYFLVITIFISFILVRVLFVREGVLDEVLIAESRHLIQAWVFSVWAGFIIMVALYFRTKKHLSRVNQTIKAALAARNLTVNMEESFQSKNIVQAIKSVDDVFDLFRSFDQLKSSRMALEFSSLKILMNNISEGIILVNAHKVVTHINHVGNDLLKLIPGETVDQALSQKISNDALLEFLDTSIKNDQKITDEKITIKENEILNVNMFPIKNKFGEVVRVLMIFERVKDEKK